MLFLSVVLRCFFDLLLQNDDLIADGLQSGCLDLMNAAMPDTQGHAIDVPEAKLNGAGCFPGGTTDESSDIGHAARMLSPGAAISSYKIALRSISLCECLFTSFR